MQTWANIEGHEIYIERMYVVCTNKWEMDLEKRPNKQEKCHDWGGGIISCFKYFLSCHPAENMDKYTHVKK